MYVLVDCSTSTKDALVLTTNDGQQTTTIKKQTTDEHKEKLPVKGKTRVLTFAKRVYVPCGQWTTQGGRYITYKNSSVAQILITFKALTQKVFFISNLR